MWNRKLFENHKALLAWLNDIENISRIRNVHIVKADPNTYYEVFYWDNSVIKKEYY